MKRIHCIRAISYLFFILFAYAAAVKLIDFKTFKEEMVESPLLGKFALLLTVTIPITEILIAIAVLMPRYRLKGLYASVVSMAIFTVYITILLYYQEPVSCDCGGLLQQIDLNTHLWINIGFLLLGLAGVILYKREEKKIISITANKTH